MSTATATIPGRIRRRVTAPRQVAEIVSRLRVARGQRACVTSIYTGGRHRMDEFDQLSAAVDATAALTLTVHVKACGRIAPERGDSKGKTAELASVHCYIESR